MRLFTIGYEKAMQDEVICALRTVGVERLIDVRAVPLSRRPGFSKIVLANGLREAGINHVHLRALGTPQEGREAAQKGRQQALQRVYPAQLDTPEAAMDAARLGNLAAEKRCCVTSGTGCLPPNFAVALGAAGRRGDRPRTVNGRAIPPRLAHPSYRGRCRRRVARRRQAPRRRRRSRD